MYPRVFPVIQGIHMRNVLCYTRALQRSESGEDGGAPALALHQRGQRGHLFPIAALGVESGDRVSDQGGDMFSAETSGGVYRDKPLTCRDCGEEFIFTAGEQAFYQEKGLLNEPRRCPSCRSARRQERSAGSGAAREMHAVICAECGAQTTVPFLPRNDRPVYCSSCFERVRAGQV